MLSHSLFAKEEVIIRWLCLLTFLYLANMSAAVYVAFRQREKRSKNGKANRSKLHTGIKSGFYIVCVHCKLSFTNTSKRRPLFFRKSKH